MLHTSWLSPLPLKVYRISSYYLVIVLIGTLAQLTGYKNILYHTGWAKFKVQVLFKPQLQKAVYYFSPKDQRLQVSAKIVGEYGERLSNVSVQLTHTCFEPVKVQSDFDAMINTWLDLKKTTNEHCQQNVLKPLKELKPTLSFNSFQETFTERRLYESLMNSSFTQLTWSKTNSADVIQSAQTTTKALDITFKVLVYKSIINSEKEFQHSFSAQPLRVEVTIKPERYVYEQEKITLLSTVISHVDLPKGLSLPKQEMIKVHLKLEKLEHSTPSETSQSSSSATVQNLMSTLEINRETELKLPIYALNHYRISYTFTWLGKQSITRQSEIFSLPPKFKLNRVEADRSFWGSKLHLHGSISPLGFPQSTSTISKYFKKLADEKRIRIKFTWNSFDSTTTTSGLNKSQTNSLDNDWNLAELDEKLLPINQLKFWSQYFVLPKNKTVQIHAQLMTRESNSSRWFEQGEAYHSNNISKTEDHSAIIWLLLSYIFSFCLAYILWRFYNLSRPEHTMPHLDIDNTLTVTRLSELNQSITIDESQSGYYICDALSHKAIIGKLTSVSLNVFGSPYRWSKEFNDLLLESIPLSLQHQTHNRAPTNLELVEGELYWVTAPNYEPLLFRVPKGSGLVIIPLWPCRFALTRIWNDLFLRLNLEQSFGHGSIKDLEQAIKVQVGDSLLSAFKLLAQVLYKDENITSEYFLDALAKLSLELDNLLLAKTLLYPPSDYQRSSKLE